MMIYAVENPYAYTGYYLVEAQNAKEARYKAGKKIEKDYGFRLDLDSVIKDLTAEELIFSDGVCTEFMLLE